MKKILLGVLAVILLVVGGGLVFLVTKKPAQRPPSSEKVEATPERLARGEYLVHNLVGCTHCHSDMDLNFFGMPGKPGSAGGGGFCWGPDMDFPGTLCARNITSDPETGIGSWTDGEVLRAMREGVSRDGSALFAIMPFEDFREMTEEDAKSVLVYIRKLAPIKRAIQKKELNPPLNIIEKFVPEPREAYGAPVDPKNEVAYGKYLVKLAGCETCHTPVDDKHQPLPGKAFSGGQEFKKAGMMVRSANITPHATGIGERTKENFVSMFKAYAGVDPIAIEPKMNTPMPWTAFANLTEQDLGAVYAYLKTVTPVENSVEKRPHPAAPTPAAEPPPGIPAAQAAEPAAPPAK